MAFWICKECKDIIPRFERPLENFLSLILDSFNDLIHILNFDIESPVSRKSTFSREYASVYSFRSPLLNEWNLVSLTSLFPFEDFLIEFRK